MARYIYGAGGHGRVVADIFNLRGITFDGFLDDDSDLLGKVFNSYKVVGNRSALELDGPDTAHEIIVAIGNPVHRLQLSQELMKQGLNLINAIHPSATISQYAQLGKGVCVCAGAVVNSNATLGDAVIVNTAATVDHDCIVAGGVHLSPGVNLSGRVTIGEATFLGVSVAVIPGIVIGARTIVGAGAVVTKNLPSDVIAAGVPAIVKRSVNSSADWSRLL